MTSDKVSIIIPSYNHAKYLDQCIDSALNQDYDNIEIILVDDGSTDGSLEIAHKYADKIIIIQKSNGGTSSAYNAGIKAMTGQWFTMIGSDDVSKPHFISNMLKDIKKLEERVNVENHIFYSGHEDIDADNNVIQIAKNNINNSSYNEKKIAILNNMFFNMNTVMINKKLFVRCGLLDESVAHHEDREFMMRCVVLHDSTLCYLDHVDTMIRRHKGSLTTDLSDRRVDIGNTMNHLILNQTTNVMRDTYLQDLNVYHKKSHIKSKLFYKAKRTLWVLLPKHTYDKVCLLWHKKETKGFGI